MLLVENLTKEYKNVTAVDNISFKVEPGKIFGLLGPNGAGKTTTIRTVLNIIRPTSGKITFMGKPITTDFYNSIGYLPEERGLYKKSKVLDVILYFAELKDMKRSLAKERAIKWLKDLGIGDYSNKKIQELSKGNQQKIQFISSVIHDPQLIILDEPFSGFDPINQEQIKELINSFLNSGKIIMLSTHLMEIAEELCSDIFLINKGKEVCSGSLQQLKKDFGTNKIKIDYKGNGAFLKDLEYVVSVDFYDSFAEVELAADYQPHQFIKNIVDKIDVNQFSVIEPTLNKIFLDVIKQN